MSNGGTRLSFEDALVAIRSGGAHANLTGLTLTVNGIALAITDEQFDLAWDAMDENGGLDEDVISLG